MGSEWGCKKLLKDGNVDDADDADDADDVM